MSVRLKFLQLYQEKLRKIQDHVYFEALKKAEGHGLCTMFLFEGCDLPDILHVTHKYFGKEYKNSDEIISTLEKYFNEHPFKPIEVTLDQEEYFGEDNDVRVLRPEQKDVSKFLPDLKETLDKLVPDKWPEYKPHASVSANVDTIDTPIVNYVLVKNGSILWSAKKLEKAELLAKAPFIEDQPSMTRPHRVGYHEGLQRIITYNAGTMPHSKDGSDWTGHAGKPLYHHVFVKTGHGDYTSHLHTLSLSPDPWADDTPIISSSVGEKDARPMSEEDAWGKYHYSGKPWDSGRYASIGESITRPSWRNHGLGYILYKGILGHHGRLISDSSVSPQANSVWRKLIAAPGVKGAMGPSDALGVHWAEHTGDKPTPISVIEYDGKSEASRQRGKLIANEDGNDVFHSLVKAVKPLAVQGDSSLGVENDKLLTVRGIEVAPNQTIKHNTKSIIDTNRGVLHTPKGSFKLYVPNLKDQDYQRVLSDSSVKDVWGSAMSNWSKLNKIVRSGTMPPDELIAHAAMFSILSANSPVTDQEMAYSHLVDVMNERGLDPTSQKFSDEFSSGGKAAKDWANRTRNQPVPSHASEYAQNTLIPALTTTAGYVRPLGFEKQRAEALSRYYNMHPYIAHLVQKHSGDTQKIVREMMADRTNPKLPKDHPSKAGAGLAMKTGRYAMGMLGFGNSVVADRHFVRHIFGLDSTLDSHTREYLQSSILGNLKNSHIMNGIDEFFRKKHPAYRMADNLLFGGQRHPDAVFPGFWLHWLSIPKHEELLGIGQPERAKNLTDHTPYWEKASEILERHGLGKLTKGEEPSYTLLFQAAQAVSDMTKELGFAPASMIYYSHIVPLLMKGSSEFQFHKTGLGSTKSSETKNTVSPLLKNDAPDHPHHDILRQKLPKEFSFISAQKDGNHNHNAHERLRHELQSNGYKPIEVQGNYDYQEKSFLVPHSGSTADKKVIEDLGRQYNQDSVLHSGHHFHNEMVYMNGNKIQVGGGARITPDADKFYTVLPDGTKYTHSLDDTKFEDPWDQAKHEREDQDLPSVKVKKAEADDIVNSLPPQPHAPSPLLENAIENSSRFRNTELNASTLYRHYKHSPHHPISVGLKYLVHRIENHDAYKTATPEQQQKMDQDFLEFHQKGDAAKKNGHLKVKDLHEFTYKYGKKLIPEIKWHQNQLHNAIREYHPDVIHKDDNDNEYIYLTRGLDTKEAGRDHALASYADVPNTGFGMHMHHRMVPLKNIWYSFDLGPKDASSESFGNENEYLVSPHKIDAHDSYANSVVKISDRDAGHSYNPAGLHLAHKNMPYDTQARYINGDNIEVKQALARRHDLHLDHQDMLANDKNTDTTYFLARNLNVYPSIQVKLANSDNKPTVRALAANINLHYNAQMLLAQNIDNNARAHLSENPNVHPDVQAILAQDKSESVRWGLARNDHARTDILHILANDKHPAVSRDATRALKSRGISPQKLAASEPDWIDPFEEMAKSVTNRPNLQKLTKNEPYSGGIIRTKGWSTHGQWKPLHVMRELEQIERGNGWYVPASIDLTSNEAIWVTHHKKDAKRYGDPDEVDLSGAKPVMSDGDGGHLYIRPIKNQPKLEKGQNGDWQKEGYTIHHEESIWEPTGTKHLDVTMKHPKYGVVAQANFTDRHGPDEWYPHNVSVNKAHQRKGLATAMLEHAARVTGKRISNTIDLSSDGKALHSAIKDKFIKSEIKRYLDDIGDLSKSPSSFDATHLVNSQGDMTPEGQAQAQYEKLIKVKIQEEIKTPGTVEFLKGPNKGKQVLVHPHHVDFRPGRHKITIPVGQVIDTGDNRPADYTSNDREDIAIYTNRENEHWKWIQKPISQEGKHVLESSDVNEHIPHDDLQKALVHGIDIEKVDGRNAEGGITSSYATSGFAKNKRGQHVVVKGRMPIERDPYEDDNAEHGVGEDFLEDHPAYLPTTHREVIFHNMARDFWGLGKYVPMTSLVRDYDHDDQHFSVMKKVTTAKHHNLHDMNHENILRHHWENGELQKLAMMDLISGNSDRHSGNYMIDVKNNRPVMIDHGFVYDYLGDREYDPQYLYTKMGFMRSGLVHNNMKKWLLGLKHTDLKKHMKNNKLPKETQARMAKALTYAKDLVKSNPGLEFKDIYNAMVKHLEEDK